MFISSILDFTSESLLMRLSIFVQIKLHPYVVSISSYGAL